MASKRACEPSEFEAKEKRVKGAFQISCLGERFGGDMLNWGKVKLGAESKALELMRDIESGKMNV